MRMTSSLLSSSSPASIAREGGAAAVSLLFPPSCSDILFSSSCGRIWPFSLPYLSCSAARWVVRDVPIASLSSREFIERQKKEWRNDQEDIRKEISIVKSKKEKKCSDTTQPIHLIWHARLWTSWQMRQFSLPNWFNFTERNVRLRQREQNPHLPEKDALERLIRT